MRIQFVACASRNTAKAKCPWFAIVIKVDGGFIAFESIGDYAQWKRGAMAHAARSFIFQNGEKILQSAK